MIAIQLRAVVFVATLIAACALGGQEPPNSFDPERQLGVTPSEPSVVWRNDGQELPPNTLGQYRNAFSADGRLIGVVHQPDNAWLLNASDGSLFYALPYSSAGGVYSIAFSSSGDFSVGRRHAVEVFDARGGSSRVIDCKECGVVGGTPISAGVIDAIAFSADGSRLVFQTSSAPTFSSDAQTALVDMKSFRIIQSVSAASNRSQVAFSPDGLRFLASSFSLVNGQWALGFEVRNPSDGTTSLKYRGDPLPESALGFVATGSSLGHDFVAVYGKKGSVEMRDLTSDRVIWTAPLLPPIFASSEAKVYWLEFERAAIAPNGRFVITYEAPAGNPIARASGGIVVRRAKDGSIVAVYNVYGVTGLSIAPDSKTFAYSTGAGKAHTALLRVPKNGML